MSAADDSIEAIRKTSAALILVAIATLLIAADHGQGEARRAHEFDAINRIVLEACIAKDGLDIFEKIERDNADYLEKQRELGKPTDHTPTTSFGYTTLSEYARLAAPDSFIHGTMHEPIATDGVQAGFKTLHTTRFFGVALHHSIDPELDETTASAALSYIDETSTRRLYPDLTRKATRRDVSSLLPEPTDYDIMTFGLDKRFDLTAAQERHLSWLATNAAELHDLATLHALVVEKPPEDPGPKSEWILRTFHRIHSKIRNSTKAYTIPVIGLEAPPATLLLIVTGFFLYFSMVFSAQCRRLRERVHRLARDAKPLFFFEARDLERTGAWAWMALLTLSPLAAVHLARSLDAIGVSWPGLAFVAAITLSVCLPVRGAEALLSVLATREA